MIYIVFLLAAIGLLVADVSGLVHVSYWAIAGIAAFPFALGVGLVFLLAAIVTIKANTNSGRK